MQQLIMWAAIAALFILDTVNGKPAKRAARHEQFLARQGLSLPPQLESTVRARLANGDERSRVWGWGGWAIGVALATAAVAVGRSSLTGMVVLIPTAIGLTLGAVRSVGRTFQRQDDAPRVARTRAVAAADYLSHSERVADLMALVTVLLASATAVGVWWLAPLRPSNGWSLPIATVVAALAVLGAMVALYRSANMLAARPQHARSALELAWDDALRGSAIRQLHDLARSLAMGAVLLLLATAASWVMPSRVRAHGMELTMNLGFAAFAVGVLCWAAVGIPWFLGSRVHNPSAALWLHEPLDEGQTRAQS